MLTTAGLVLCTFAVSVVHADKDLRQLRAIELETELAQDSDLYLYFDPPAQRLAIKVRGLEVAAIDIIESSRLIFRPLFGEVEAPPLPAPAIWTVTEGPGDADRETIAPTTLRPYSEDEERQEPATTTTKKKEESAEEDARSSYRIQLDIGWQILVVDRVPELGWSRRLIAAVRDGWQRLRGAEPSHPPLIALVVSTEDARLLHHLFRDGTRILVAPIE